MCFSNLVALLTAIIRFKYPWVCIYTYLRLSRSHADLYEAEWMAFDINMCSVDHRVLIICCVDIITQNARYTLSMKALRVIALTVLTHERNVLASR